MDQDFRFYGIGFIARAAGFNKQDSLTIVYASQYVDDSTEGFYDMPRVKFHRAALKHLNFFVLEQLL